MTHLCQCPPDTDRHDQSGNCFKCGGRLVCCCGHIPCICELTAQAMRGAADEQARMIAEGRLVKKEIFPGLYKLVRADEQLAE